MMKVNTTCRICQGINLTRVIDLGMQPLANSFLKKEELVLHEPKYPLEVYFCEDCNLAQLIHVVDKNVLFEDYIYFSSGMPKLSDHFQKYAEDIKERFLQGEYDLVVEIGSNDGILLNFFKQNNFRVLGIDPAKNIAKVAQERGVNTVVDFFSEELACKIASESGRSKAIIGNNVIAHINDYQDLCRGIKSLLDKDGVFVFEAPYLLDMFERLTFDTIYHEHLNFLAIRPLIRLFELYDLEIFDVKIVSKQGQSIRVFVGHKGFHKVRASVAGCVEKEKALGLHKLESYLSLAEKIKGCKDRVVDLILQLKKEGKRIAAYGAPAKGNTLLNYYGIGSNNLDFALDELPSKQNLYTPGSKVLVIDLERAKRNQPDYYLLLAWNYLNIILEKEKEFLANGGRFILPNGEIIKDSVSKESFTAPFLVNKKILICGGSGFIGSNFIRYLHSKYPGYKLYNLDLLTYSGNKKNLVDIEIKESESEYINRRYNFIYGDICDKSLLDHLFLEYKFDIIVNFAAESHVDRSLCSSYDFIRTNVVGVHNLIEACFRHKISRFVQISTDEVYGDVQEGFSVENSPLNPSSPYSASKASADVLIKSYMRSHKMAAVIVRGSNNFGPYQYPEKLIPLVVSNFIRGEKSPVHGTGMHIRSWLHVIDFCEAIDLVMHKGIEGHIYNVNGVHKTNMEVIEAIWSALKLQGDMDDYKVHTNDRPGADLRYAPDAGKISKALGWEPKRFFDDTIGEVVQWYVDNNAWWEEIRQRPMFLNHYERQRKADYY